MINDCVDFICAATFEDKVCPTHDPSGVESSAVAPSGVDGEGGVFTNGVGVVVVVAFPCVVFVMEDEVAGEEENLGADLTPLAHPLTVQTHSDVGTWGQDGRVELIGAVDDTTDDAAVVMVLQTKRDEGGLFKWLIYYLQRRLILPTKIS